MFMNKKKYYPWLVVGLLWVVALLNYMDRQMLSTMQHSMQADIHELNQRIAGIVAREQELREQIDAIVADLEA